MKSRRPVSSGVMLLSFRVRNMPHVNIIGWRPGLRKTSMVHILQEHLGLGLQAAKDSVDRVAAGESITFTLEDLVDATALAQALEDVGAIVELAVDANSLRAASTGET